jgi:hypothetical protein
MHGAQGYKVLLQWLRVTMRAITHHCIGYKVLLQGLRLTMRAITLDVYTESKEYLVSMDI